MSYCRTHKRLLPIIAMLTVVAACEPSTSIAVPEPASVPVMKEPGPVVLFARRSPVGLQEILAAYRTETGAAFEIRTGDAATADLQGELHNADLIIANSFAEIWSAAESDALRPVFSDTINRNITTALRDPESRWIALATRARVVVYNTGLLTADELTDVQTYASLGEDDWRGRLCLSSSRVAGNLSLVAFLIRQHGNREAEIVVRKWRANLATTVFDNDEALLQAVADGTCALGIADSSKLISLRSTTDNAAVEAHWFRSPGGQFLDISAAGVSRHAANPAGAKLLLEWLTSDAANAISAHREKPICARRSE